MENVILVIHLILAICLIGIVLLQRSEGGGLGMGGGGAMTGRQAATAMTKLTWTFAILFLATSIALTVVAARNAAGGSVVDLTSPPAQEETAPALPQGQDLLPPTGDGGPVLPPPSE